jgi:5-hydroxyisourate hydrolase-like protein (transthyretin family)
MSARPTLLVALATAAAIVGALVTPLSASAAEPGGITGVLSLSTGKPAAAVTVSVVPADAPYYLATPQLGTAVTSKTGAFSIPNVTPGSYTLRFSAVGGHYAQYLGGATTVTAGDAVVVSESVGTYVRASLAASGTLKGVVKGSNGKAVKGVTVASLSQNDAGHWITRATTVTSASGAYSFSAAPGDWRLRISSTTGAVPTVFSGNTALVADATTLRVTKAATTTYNFSALTQGTITGKVAGLLGAVTDPDVAGVRVTALRLHGPAGFASSMEPVRSVVTGAAGTFSIGGLAPGNYQLRFDPASLYGSTYLGDVTQPLQSTGSNVATVTAGATASVGTRTLGAFAPLTGSVKWGSYPQQGVPVFITKHGEPYSVTAKPGDEKAVTGADGTFSISGLGAGTWIIQAGSAAAGFTSALGYNTNHLYPTLNQITLVAGTPYNTGALATSGSLVDPPTTVTQIVGSPQVGSTLTAVLPTYPEPHVLDGAIWLRNGRAIPGATELTYVPTAADLGASISLRVSGTSTTSGTESSQSSAVTIGLGTLPEVTGSSPAMVGSVTVGSAVTAATGDWSMQGLRYGYAWYVDPSSSGPGTLVGTGARFIPVAAQLGSYLRLEVTASRAGFGSATFSSASALITIGAAPAATKAPTVKKSGSTATVTPGTWSPAVTSFGYDWQFRDSASDGAWTSFGSALSQSLAGRTAQAIRVIVTATPTGHQSSTRTLTVQTGTAPVATGNRELPASVYAGETLIGPAPTWPANTSLNDTTVTHSWQYKSGSKWKTITGTTFNYYVVPVSMIGATIRDVVTARTAGYAPSVVTTAPRVVQPQRTLYATSPSQLAGSDSVPGQLMCGYPGDWSQPGATFTQEWQVARTAAYTTVATSQCYTPTLADADRPFRLVVTAKKKNFVTATSVTALSNIKLGTFQVTTQGSTTISGGNYVVTPPVLSPASSNPLQYSWDVFNESTGAYITGGFGTTYPASNGGAGRVVRVSYTATQFNYYQFTGSFIAGATGTLSVNTTPTISAGASPVYGTTITVSNGLYTGAQPTVFSYQWQRNYGTDVSPSWFDIGLATTSSYVPDHVDMGKTLRARVTASRVGWDPVTLYSSATNPVVVAGNLDVTIAPDVVGTPRVGAPLIADSGSGWNQTGIQYDVTWYRVPASGPDEELGQNYTPVAADRNNAFRLLVAASKPGWGGISTVSTFYLYDGLFVVKKAPTVKKSSTTFSVTGASWTPAATSVQYLWQVFDGAGAVVQQSTAATLPVSGTAGKRVTVTLTPSATAYSGGVATVTAQAGAAIAYTGPATMANYGPSIVGGGLAVINNAEIESWNWVPGTTTVVWKRNGKVITGLTPTTFVYMFTTADIGATISATLSRATPGYATSTKTFTNPTKVLSAVVLAPTVSPTLSVDVTVDKPVKLSPGTWPTGTTLSYQWYLGSDPIPGATALTFTPTGDVAGRVLSARVTASKTHFSSVVVSTATSDIGIGAAASAPNPTLVSAGGVVTSTLGAVPSGFTVTVQWYRNGSPIAGDNAATHSLTGADAGATLTVRYTATRLGHTTATFEGTLTIP